MTTVSRAGPGGRVFRLALAGFFAVLAAGGLGAFPTYRLAGSEGLVAQAVGCGIAWIAGIVGFLPGCVMMDRAPNQAALGFLAGSLIRFVVAVFLGLPVVLSGSVQLTPLLLWIGIGYMAVLGMETYMVVRLLKTPARSEQS